MRTRALLMVVLAAGILLGLGCEKSIVGPRAETSATYRLGTLKSDVPADMNTTYRAAEQAMKDLDLTVLQSTGGQLGATIIARDAWDQRIRINLTSLTETSTKMTIDSGSQANSTRIYRQVVSNLPPVTAQAQPVPQP
jgi:hypothetical protein